MKQPTINKVIEQIELCNNSLYVGNALACILAKPMKKDKPCRYASSTREIIEYGIKTKKYYACYKPYFNH